MGRGEIWKLHTKKRVGSTDRAGKVCVMKRSTMLPSVTHGWSVQQYHPEIHADGTVVAAKSPVHFVLNGRCLCNQRTCLATPSTSGHTIPRGDAADKYPN